MAIGRRRLLTSVALTALAAPVLARGSATRAVAAEGTGTAAGMPVAGGDGPLFLQVVAHEDDDILFMNPDLSNALANGTPSVTVFVTAGNITRPGPAAVRGAGHRPPSADTGEWASRPRPPSADGSCCSSATAAAG
ncbi:hypothetical protein ACWGKU_37870 [Kitasatospora sp. NPDC054768]